MNVVPRIAAIGDSFIYGRHDPAGGGWVGRLRASLEEPEAGSAVFNLGIGGETSRDVLRRMDAELASREPNCIIIGVGTNDTRRSAETASLEIDPAETERNLRTLCELAKRKASRVVVASVIPVVEARTRPLDGMYYSNAELRATRSVQEGVARAFGALFLDFWTVIEREAETIYSDGLHLTGNGHKRLFEHAAPLIRKLFHR